MKRSGGTVRDVLIYVLALALPSLAVLVGLGLQAVRS